MCMFHWLRTIVFYVVYILWTVIWSSVIVITVRLLPIRWRHTYGVGVYGFVVPWLCRLICGVRWRVEGKENIPNEACVVAANHQSSWETFYLQFLFTPQATVLKQELLKLPFFGWALKSIRTIAINRNDPRQAMKQMNEQGVKAIKDGYWVMVFPEGTRQKWPTLGRYMRGASTLALKAEVAVLPVVHNAGQFWPGKQWLKTPGEIVVKIGKPISVKGRTAKEVNEELKAWSQENLT